MILNEKKGNLFELDKEKYTFAHCISLDDNFKEGIVKQFKKEFKGLQSFCKKIIEDEHLKVPITITYTNNSYDAVFNLITKNKYSNKPTYEAITSCIEQMADICKSCNVKYLAIPKLGCGLDGLQWGKVREIIMEKFKDIDITIEVRYL